MRGRETGGGSGDGHARKEAADVMRMTAHNLSYWLKDKMKRSPSFFEEPYMWDEFKRSAKAICSIVDKFGDDHHGDIAGQFVDSLTGEQVFDLSANIRAGYLKATPLLESVVLAIVKRSRALSENRSTSLLAEDKICSRQQVRQLQIAAMTLKRMTVHDILVELGLNSRPVFEKQPIDKSGPHGEIHFKKQIMIHCYYFLMKDFETY